MWWNLYSIQVLPNLIPFGSYKESRRHENLKTRDVCLLKFNGKIRGLDRLCKVKAVQVDAAGLTRTVTIQMRPRDKREKVLPYKAKPLTEMEVGVKRLCLIHPVEDPLGLAGGD